MKPEIIYEDQDLIVCYKPPKFPVQSDKTGDEDLKTYLEKYIKKSTGVTEPYVGLVHRIDRPVGGLVVFAKKHTVAVYLSKQLQDRTIKKTYHAVVEGNPGSGTYEDYLKKRMKDNTSHVVDANNVKAKKAILHYKTIATIDDLSLVEIMLETGRHHQIRVQFAHHQHALFGDTKYNPTFQNKKGWHQIALFATKIEFIHPSTKRLVSFEKKPVNAPFDQFVNHI